MEEWKTIEGYPNYMVSSEGRIKNIATNKNIKPYNTLGYRTVTLYNNGIGRKMNVHRLVGKAFIPNPDNKPQINHKNGVRSDNRVENLEWVTNQENTLHSFRVLDSTERRKKISEAMKVIRKGIIPVQAIEANSKPVIQIETGKVFRSIREAADEIGCSESLIYMVCCKRPKHKTAKGYHFEYYKKGVRQ